MDAEEERKKTINKRNPFEISKQQSKYYVCNKAQLIPQQWQVNLYSNTHTHSPGQ